MQAPDAADCCTRCQWPFMRLSGDADDEPSDRTEGDSLEGGAVASEDVGAVPSHSGSAPDDAVGSDKTGDSKAVKVNDW